MDPEVANKQFVAFQSAFDILTNPVTRRKYDSSRPFDDVIPSEKEAETAAGGMKTQKEFDSFYALFNPVFERNAKWSTLQPVPSMPAWEDVKEGTKLDWKSGVLQYESNNFLLTIR